MADTSESGAITNDVERTSASTALNVLIGTSFFSSENTPVCGSIICELWLGILPEVDIEQSLNSTMHTLFHKH